jgi:hypothetical protein
MIKRFPLPYASLTSCYYGIIGKDYKGIRLQRPLIFKNNNMFQIGKHCVWQFSHIGLITPCYSEYTDHPYTHRVFSDLELKVNINNFEKHIYMEKIEITHVMKDVFHLFIEASENKNGKLKILLRKHYKWMTSPSIHELRL